MDFDDSKLKKRESRTRAPTACQTCRLRKTRCDNSRPTCSYCVVQGVDCIYPETSPRLSQSGYDTSNQEILQQLSHISSLLEDIKQGNSLSGSSTRSLRSTLLELTTQNTSPLTDIAFPGNTHAQAGSSNGDYRTCEHDADLLYVASSAELMLRWPVYERIVTDAEKNIRSFLLDSLDAHAQSAAPPPQQVGDSHLVAGIQHLCRKYIMLVHRRNPVLYIEKLEHYAREVSIQGLESNSQSCLVLLACALACCTSSFIPLAQVPEDLDHIPEPPPSDADMGGAWTYFHAAKQRFVSLTGFYHRHVMRPLEAWFCFQQASSRLEVRLRSLCREQWRADANYHNLESRLYWSCIQAEYSEMQGELPLWSSRLERFGSSEYFPSLPVFSSSPENIESDIEAPINIQSGVSGTEEQKGWRFYIGTICNRRTVNEMLVDIWRNGEEGWMNNVGEIVDRTSEAVKVVASWHQLCHSGLSSPSSSNQDLEFFLSGRYHIACEKIYRPVFYLAIHFQSLPSWVQTTPHISQSVFSLAQKAIDNCAHLLPNFFYHFRHEWVHSVVRSAFACAIHILAAVLNNVTLARNPNPGGWALRPPENWGALVRLGIRILRLWESESVDVQIMRAMLERMFQGTCRLAGVRFDCF
ncbi:hypothetical protein N7466_005634 [Penicillium verhagenii]|uniref:uncharacterized protein n=1 Tax=Penicillium verhagenii TaxID=1562060 RepID=UPI0025453CDE|nr:uncharacterized protein N7466_005634 [Penicillium verhagenii]KAJ5930141.1 hypothetical protein N7466_005634 [Penicillium verhagenii]